MQYSPRISVILPTFNSSPYLVRCLGSILNQSVKEFEIIAVDDQSTDNTIDILNKYAENNPNIKIVQIRSKSLAGGARNAGLELAKGKYISFIDSDDWIDTNYFYFMLKIIEDSNADLGISGVKREYENAKDSCVRYQYSADNIIHGEYALSLLSKMVDQDISISAIVCNKLFRSSFIKNHGLKFFENCLNEDDIFIFNSLLEANTICITSETNYHLYQRKNSISRNFTKKHIDDLFFAFVEIRKLLESKEQFGMFKKCYYAFFEKCLCYLIESLIISEQNDEIINQYFKYAYSIARNAISINEFIEYCGNRRIVKFFIPS